MPCLYKFRSTLFDRLKRLLCIRTQVNKFLPQFLTSLHHIDTMGGNGPVLIAHFQELNLKLSSNRTQMYTRRVVDMFNCLDDQFELFRQRFVLFTAHAVLEDKVNHENLASLYCLLYFFTFLLSLRSALLEILNFLLRSHCAQMSHKFCLFSFPSENVPLFPILRIINFPSDFNFLIFVPLGLCTITLSFLSCIVQKGINSFFKNIKKRIFKNLFLLFFLHQLLQNQNFFYFQQLELS